MESDGQLPLHDLVAARLKDAHTTVRSLQVPEGVRVALLRKLLVITAASKHDLAGAAQRLDRLMEDIEQGRLPAGQEGPRADGSA